jgi:hypothetical protein
MGPFFLYLISMFTGTLFLSFFCNWIKTKHENSRPIFTVVISFITAYATSFFCDMFVQLFIGNFTFRNALMPLITWLIISLILYFQSKELSTNKLQVGIPFYIIGLIACITSIIGHFYNLYVGILVLLVGITTNMIKHEKNL